jgi:hypothetical protein
VPEVTGSDEGVGLADAAHPLYGVAPAAFTTARTAAAREARQAKDRALATAVGALRKPSAAAAAVNLLVRERPDDLGRLLDLGVRLREAQAALAGADLRALHTEQQRTVGEVADTAVGLLADAGGTAGAAVRGQVEATLRAAMGDPDAAAAVATGLLVRDLFSSGFEPVDVDGAVAVPDAPPLAGAPARRTPLRAVPESAAEDEDAVREDDGTRPGRRRRGRLITTDEPDQPLRAAEQAAPRRRGRVVATGEPEQEAGTPAPASRAATSRQATSRRTTAGQAATPRERGQTERERAQTERERRAEQERAARERRAEQERADRERRREAARRSADEDVTLARQETEQCAAERDAADERLAAAEERAAELGGTIERAQEEIARLRAALADAEREAREVGLEVRHARSARSTAAKAAERAASRLRDAEAARDRL